MTEAKKPAKPPRLVKGLEHHGEMKPVRYPDSLGKKVGGWLVGLLTSWKR